MTIVLDMPDSEYHSRPELSSTGVRLLLPDYKGSPMKFQWEKTHKRNSRAFDVGHAAHAKVLGVGASIIAYPDEHLTPSGNVSTKAATVAWESEQYAAGLTPVSPNEIEKVDHLAEAILAHEKARPLLEVCEFREVSVFADVDGVPCRARLDALSTETRNGVYAIDVKTAPDATDQGFTRSVNKYGYDVQEAHYREVYKASEGVEISEFWFIVAEPKGPYEVVVHRLEPFWVDMGRKKAATARRIYQQCIESGVWPGYESKAEPLTAPAYAVIEHELAYENGEIDL